MEERSFEREVLDRLIKIETKIDGVDRIKDQVYLNKDHITTLTLTDTQQQKQIDDMLAEQKWLKHTVVAAVIVGAIGIVYGVIKIGIGLIV